MGPNLQRRSQAQTPNALAQKVFSADEVADSEMKPVRAKAHTRKSPKPLAAPPPAPSRQPPTASRQPVVFGSQFAYWLAARLSSTVGCTNRYDVWVVEMLAVSPFQTGSANVKTLPRPSSL
jgi:hypothetical protein